MDIFDIWFGFVDVTWSIDVGALPCGKYVGWSFIIVTPRGNILLVNWLDIGLWLASYGDRPGSSSRSGVERLESDNVIVSRPSLIDFSQIFIISLYLAVWLGIVMDWILVWWSASITPH